MLIPLVVLGCTGEIPEECAEPDKITVYADNDNDHYGAPETAKLVCPPLNAMPAGDTPGSRTSVAKYRVAARMAE